MRTRLRSLILAVVLVGGLSACAAEGLSAPVDSPTPIAACPAVEGQELPPECAPYDPDAAMAANDRYRERMDLTDAAAAENERAAEPAADALRRIRAAGDISEDSVRDALEGAGLGDAQVREDQGRVLFGVSGPAGGCIYGDVTAGGITIDVGGYIFDGGCLPAQ